MSKISLRHHVFQGPLIGFVPTMGALHEGHLSLVRAALGECDKVVVSIFVNPTQFGKDEDFEKYPRDLERDKALLLREGEVEIWCPTVAEIYPEGIMGVDLVEPPRELTDFWCGKERPGHFAGVATVVKRLFEHVKPTDVYFGQKDYQQTRVIAWLIDEFFKGMKLHVLPTVREKDGLAMSSRNAYLNDGERVLAASLRQYLDYVNKLFEQGERGVDNLLATVPGNFEYAEIRDAKTLAKIDRVERPAVLAVAASFGKTRLIDNMVLNPMENPNF